VVKMMIRRVLFERLWAIRCSWAAFPVTILSSERRDLQFEQYCAPGGLSSPQRRHDTGAAIFLDSCGFGQKLNISHQRPTLGHMKLQVIL